MQTSDSAGGAIHVAGGRRLEWCQWGPTDGAPVFWLHGLLGGRLLRHVEGEYERVGARVITFDRPGFGRSDRHAGRRVVDGANDVVAVADHLDIDRFAVVGVSMGGPYALATSALHPDRVTRCATVVTSAPMHAHGLDAMADLPAEMREDRQRVLAGGESAVLEEYERARTFVAGMADVVPPVGEEASHAMAVAAFTDALGAGPWGFVDDWLADAGPWGFEVAVVAVPVRMMVAKDDPSVPVSHVRWFMGQLPDVEVEWVNGDHFGPRQQPEELLFSWAAGNTR